MSVLEEVSVVKVKSVPKASQMAAVHTAHGESIHDIMWNGKDMLQ